MTIPPDLINHVVAAIYNHQGSLRDAAANVQHIAPDMASQMLTTAKRLYDLTLEPFTADAVRVEPSPTGPCNPDGLTLEQIGVADGWRPLDENEITQEIDTDLVECWACIEKTWDSCVGHGAMWSSITYRTKLSRTDLAAALRAVNGETPR